MKGQGILTRKQRRAGKRALDAIKKGKSIAKGGMNVSARMKKELKETGKSIGYSPYPSTENVEYKFKAKKKKK